MTAILAEAALRFASVQASVLGCAAAGALVLDVLLRLLNLSIYSLLWIRWRIRLQLRIRRRAERIRRT